MLAIRATTRDPEIFNNVYNAIAREAPCNGSFNDLQSARSSKPMLFRSNSLFAGSCCFLSPRKTSEILNPDVSVVKSAFSVPFFPPSLHFFPSIFGDIREREVLFRNGERLFVSLYPAIFQPNLVSFIELTKLQTRDY